jgi:hypothetical protein
MPIKMKFEIGELSIPTDHMYKKMYGEFDGKTVDVYGFFHAPFNGLHADKDYAYVRFPGDDYLESVELTYLSFPKTKKK